MTDFDSIRLNAIYEVIAVTALLVTRAGQEKTLNVIDKTTGVAVALGDTSVQTIKPAAAVRMTELAEKNLGLADVDDGQIEFNGTKWRINNYMLRPGLGGESKGEAFLLLVDEKLDE